MNRIAAIELNTATGRAKELLDAVKTKLGAVPNLTRVMATSPPVLEGYLGLSGALGQPSVLSAQVKEQLALDVGEANACDYCVAAHSFLGKKAGLSEKDVSDSRHGRSTDPKTDALLQFARTVIDTRGQVTDADLSAVRAAGYGDAAIAETVAHVALNVFTNFLNNVAQTVIDFPKPAPLDHHELCASIPGCDPTR